MSKHLDSVMETQVSRKEFLTMGGLFVGTIFGFGSLIRLLTGHDLANHKTNSPRGFGSGSYGT